MNATDRRALLDLATGRIGRAANNTGYGDLGDDEIFGDVLASDTVVRSYLRPIKRHMLEHQATEIWINKPGELIVPLRHRRPSA